MPKDCWDKFEIVFKAVVGLVVVPLLSLWIVQYHANKTLERQLQAQAKTLEQQLQSQAEQSRSQRQMAEAQLAAGLIPTITSAREAERNLALTVLSSVAPGLAGPLSAMLIEKAQTPAQKNFARDINRRSVQNEMEREFAAHLENAKQYRSFGLDAQAYREYLVAFRVIPDRFRSAVGKKQKSIDDARSNYCRGNFSAAAQLLEEVFRRLPAQQ